ncbi:P-loop NTPase fold protein [Bacteroides reticulotermitis]|uniref:P-loop NTPase fold protein n=1 Tax=Bacteroides reticulotermitis TaxID=1133319 RepID=UPI003A8B7924
MDTEYVSRYLNDYINMDNPQYAVMLKGKWGCGKTYYINNLIKAWNTEIKSSKGKIALRPVYISLNGVSSVSHVSFMIKKELRPFLYSKGMKVAQKVLFGTIKAVTKVDLDNDGNKDDLSDCFDAESIIDILSKSNDSVIGKKIVVIDDLERCKIPTDEIFGYVNNLVEHSNCKVILIGEEDKIKAAYEKGQYLIGYKDFKEKLIGQTFSINQNFENIINQFIEDNLNEYLTANKDMVVELFIASGVENLRIIKHFFTDFRRLIKLINPSNFRKKQFDDFIKNVICYFVITYCEHKSGNAYITYFQDINYCSEDKENDGVYILAKKYNRILKKYAIAHSIYIFKIESIIYFIDNGFILDLQTLLNSNMILNERSIAEWEHIWSYWELDNQIFDEKLIKVKNLFYKDKIDFVSIVLHISGMLLKFNRMKIINCSEDYVVKRAKLQIDNIYKNNKFSSMGEFMVGIDGTSWGKQYMQLESPEMKNLIEYAEKKLSDYQESERILFCKKIWEDIKDAECESLYSIFNKSIPDGRSTYNLTSIFCDVNVTKTASSLMRLSNKSKYNLIYFLSSRYYLPRSRTSGVISDYHIKDLPFLIAIKDTLEIKIKRTKRLDKIAMNELIGTIELCINELKSAS